MINLLLNDTEDVLRITLSNNSVNSINICMLKDLHKALDDIDARKIRCVVFDSNKKHFCAGADLKERSGFSEKETLSFLDSLNELYHRIESLSMPTICIINGACLGGGLELALSCDFRIGLPASVYSFPETSIGIIPGAGGTQRMTQLVGVSRSMEWIFTAKKYSSEDALESGVIDFLIDKSDLNDHIEAFILSIVKNAPMAIKAAKKSINSTFIEAGFRIEREQYLKVLRSEDRNEGLTSFKEKRSPEWMNK